MTVDVSELLPCPSFMQMMIDIAVEMLRDKDYKYSIIRLQKIETELFRYWCIINEDVMRP